MDILEDHSSQGSLPEELREVRFSWNLKGETKGIIQRLI